MAAWAKGQGLRPLPLLLLLLLLASDYEYQGLQQQTASYIHRATTIFLFGLASSRHRQIHDRYTHARRTGGIA